MSDAYIRDPENDLTYDSNTGSYVLTSSLISDYTLTIVPTPSDATVTLTAEGYTQSGNSITVPEGLTVIYSIVRPGYAQKRDSVVVDSDITLNITLNQAEVDIIDESTTVKELEVNSTVYDIVGKGILDQNTKTTQLEWFGTLAEYEALEEYSDYCTYYITDDSADSNADEVGAIAEDVNTLKGYDYVVDWQVPTSDNNYTWYRKYKSGWVEQGGKVGALNNSNITVTLPVAMANSSYTVLATGQNIDTASNYAVVIKQPTTTTIIVSSLANYGAGATWQVSGMAA